MPYPRLFSLLLPLSLSLLLSLALSAATATAATPAKRPPNIVFFLADDLGRQDLGSYGSTFYETPHLDRLAREGARFTDAYAACPVCSPTRASVLTGQWPQRTGITDYIGAPQSAAWKRNTPLLPADYTDRLALDAPTLAKSMPRSSAANGTSAPRVGGPKIRALIITLVASTRAAPMAGNNTSPPTVTPA